MPNWGDDNNMLFDRKGRWDPSGSEELREGRLACEYCDDRLYDEPYYSDHTNKEYCSPACRTKDERINEL